MRLARIAFVIFLLSSSAGAQVTPSPAEGVLVLQNGNVLSGVIELVGDRYRVVLGQGEIGIAARQGPRPRGERGGGLRGAAGPDAQHHRWAFGAGRMVSASEPVSSSGGRTAAGHQVGSSTRGDRAAAAAPGGQSACCGPPVGTACGPRADGAASIVGGAAARSLAQAERSAGCAGRGVSPSDAAVAQRLRRQPLPRQCRRGAASSCSDPCIARPSAAACWNATGSWSPS